MADWTLSYACGVSAVPLIGRTIGDFFDEVCQRYGEREALVSVFEGRRWTYAEMKADVDRVARGLMKLGVRKGEKVGIWSTNCAAWVMVQFATAKVGAVLVNVNPAYRRHEVEFALRQSECAYLLIGEGFKDVRYAEVVEAVRGELAGLKVVVTLPGCARGAGMISWEEMVASGDGRGVARARAGSGGQECPPLTRPMADKNVCPTIKAEDPAAEAASPLESLAQRQAALDFDDVINIQYTSGTTGAPKGAMLTHHSILNNGFFVGERMRLTSTDRLCIPVPFYHCFGMVLGNLAAVTHGAAMVLPAPHFSPVHTLEAVAKERCTALHGVPTMFVAQLDHPRFAEFDLSSLRTGIMAGAPCPIHVMRRVVSEMHCREITIACGMTETSPVCNMTEIEDPLEVRVGSVGRVMPHQEQKIVDPVSGAILPRGQQGELCYRGYQVMRGYYNNPEATRGTIDAAGWLHGGDLAVMDGAGYVRITGRLKDMICRGGEKIFPREVEEFLFTHPDVAEAYVFGIPDDYYGEEVAAWVKLKEGRTMTAEELVTWCRERIMEYKVPRRVRFVTDFPTTVTGKIQKFRMREAEASENLNAPQRR